MCIYICVCVCVCICIHIKFHWEYTQNKIVVQLTSKESLLRWYFAGSQTRAKLPVKTSRLLVAARKLVSKYTPTGIYRDLNPGSTVYWTGTLTNYATLGTTPIYWEYGQSRMYYSVAVWWEEKDWYHKPIVGDGDNLIFISAIHLNYKWNTGRLWPPNN